MNAQLFAIGFLSGALVATVMLVTMAIIKDIAVALGANAGCLRNAVKKLRMQNEGYQP